VSRGNITHLEEKINIYFKLFLRKLSTPNKLTNMRKLATTPKTAAELSRRVLRTLERQIERATTHF